VAEIRSIALDASSRTSAVLTQILCTWRFGISPAFSTHPPDLPAMLASADAALVIGDTALFADAAALGATKVDLGATWSDMTGLPFVWAFWAGRPDAADAGVVQALQDAAETGMAHSDAVADAFVAGRPDRRELARHYLRHNLMFRLTPRAGEGLRAFYREARALGLLEDIEPSIAFFEAEHLV
jgi:chorismate dehydratase